MIVDRKRKTAFQTFKMRGENKYVLHLYSHKLPNGKKPYQEVNIPLEYGGKLAVTPSRWQDRYEVSFAKLPDDVKEQVRVAVAHIESQGTPMDNDESVFT